MPISFKPPKEDVTRTVDILAGTLAVTNGAAIKERLWFSLTNSVEQGQCFRLHKAFFSAGGHWLADNAHEKLLNVEVYDIGGNEDQLFNLNLNDLYRAAIRAMMDPELKIAFEYRARLFRIVTDPEGADTDAYDDDILLQIAAFGEVIYG